MGHQRNKIKRYLSEEKFLLSRDCIHENNTNSRKCRVRECGVAF